MKSLKLLGIAFVCAMILVSASPFLTVSSAADKPLKWRMGILVPRGLSWDVIFNGFCEDVKRLSNGQLEIQAVYDGEGVVANQIFGAVRDGLLEMGMPFMAHHVGELPAGAVEMGLPGGPTSWVHLRALFQQAGWTEELRKAYARHGIYYLGEYYQPGTYVLTKNAIKTIDDFKGLKIRCPGSYGKMIRNLGGSPVVMAFSEVYTSLATGVVDGADSCTLIDHRDGKFYEVAKYLYPLPLTGSQVTNIIVNLEAWKELPVRLQTVLEFAAYRMADFSMTMSLLWEQEALQEMLSKGLKYSPQPSKSDIATWQQAGRETWKEWEAKDKYCKELIRIQADFMKKIGYEK